MRVLVLSQYYAPEPVPKPSELAEALVLRGHSVSVVTGVPNYPRGRMYPGFRNRFVRREVIGGVQIVRTALYPYHGDSGLRRSLNYASFMVSSVLGALVSPKCEAIYVWHPPLTIGLSAWIIGRLKRAPFVYDVQDIWPESLTAAGKVTSRWLVWAMHRLERFIYRRAHRVLVVTPKAKENLVAKGIATEKVSVVPQWVEATLFEDLEGTGGEEIRRKYGLGRRFTVTYAGNMGLLQGLDTVVRCATLLRSDPGIVFVMVGDGVERERLEAQARDLSLPNVVFVDRQPMSAMRAWFSSADALLVHLKHSLLSDLVIPNKTLAYLAAARPIVMACNGAAAQLVREAGAGIVIPPGAPEAMAEAVLRLSRLGPTERLALGERGRAYVRAHHAKEVVLDEYERILAEACRGCRGYAARV